MCAFSTNFLVHLFCCISFLIQHPAIKMSTAPIDPQFSLISSKLHASTPGSQSLAPKLKYDDKSKSHRDDTCLDTESISRTHGRDPRYFIVCNDESTNRSTEIDPSCNLTRGFWVCIEQV